jgi:hypothetical protein
MPEDIADTFGIEPKFIHLIEQHDEFQPLYLYERTNINHFALPVVSADFI